MYAATISSYDRDRVLDAIRRLDADHDGIIISQIVEALQDHLNETLVKRIVCQGFDRGEIRAAERFRIKLADAA